MTREQAQNLVSTRIQRFDHAPGDTLIVLEDYTLSKPYGWVFFWGSKRYHETRDINYAITGNGPVVVEAATGQLTMLGTARAFEDELRDFERARGY